MNKTQCECFCIYPVRHSVWLSGSQIGLAWPALKPNDSDCIAAAHAIDRE